MHHCATDVTGRLHGPAGCGRTPGLPATDRAGGSIHVRFPPNEIVGMGYFPDELGLVGSPRLHPHVRRDSRSRR